MQIDFPLKIVNLERRIDRKQKTIEQIKKKGIELTEEHFFKAVDGKKIKLNEELYNLFKGNDFNYTPGAIGCALSHYYLWKQLILDNYADYYLIMEDDCEISPDFKNVIEMHSELFKKNDSPNFYFLSYLQKTSTPITHNYSFKKWTNANYVGGTQCYAINKQGAVQLINYIGTNGIKQPIDWITCHIDNGLNIYELENHIVFSDYVGKPGTTNVDSDIQYERETIELDDDFINKQFAFYDHKDQSGNDLYFIKPILNKTVDMNYKLNSKIYDAVQYLKIQKYKHHLLLKALDDVNVVAVNHLGYFKNKIDILEQPDNFKGKGNGIYVKKNILLSNALIAAAGSEYTYFPITNN